MVIGLAIAGLAFSACRRPGDVGRDLQTSLSNEQIQFQALTEAESKAGDVVAEALSNWGKDFTNLSAYAAELAALVSKAKPEELNQYQSQILAIQGPLDDFMNRSQQIELLVPTWQFEESQKIVTTIPARIQNLSASYQTIFGRAPNRPTLAVSIQKDDRLLDTYGDCVALFANSEPNCKIAATERCTHQTNIDCVKRSVEENSGFFGISCTEYRTYKDETYEYIATWIKVALSACISTAPIFK